MDFSLSGPDRLKVSLSADDLEAFGMDYQNLDYNDGATREILLELLNKGRAEVGFLPKRAKLYIEIYPREGGGCVIYYTRLPGNQPHTGWPFLPGPSPIAFAFADAQTLLDGCAKAYGLYRHRIYKSSLYALGAQYRLIIYPLDYNDNLSVNFLSEYGRLVGEGQVLASYIEEHGKLLRESTALETLAKIEGVGFE